MTALVYIALGAATFAIAMLVAEAFDRLDAAPGDCICRKGAWHPECPVHGRRDA